MFLKTVAISTLVFIVSTLSQISSKNAVISDVYQCFNKTCPPNTYHCKKHTFVSRDRNYLLTDISCLDIDKNALQHYHDSSDNPYGRNLIFDSYSFSSVFLFERRIPVIDGYENRDATFDRGDADITNKENAIK